MQIISPYKPTEKQTEAHAVNKRHVLFGGAMGGGKSAWLSGHIIDRMVRYAGNRGYIGRKNFSDFKISTYISLLKFLDDYIVKGLVTENKSMKVFRFWNGSELYYGAIEADQGEDKKNPLFSAEFGIIAVDEAWEMSEEAFKKLITRLRHTLPDDATEWHSMNKMGRKCPHYQIIMSTNPAQNWLKQRFILSPNPETDAFVQSLPKENPYNPDDYEQQMRDAFRGDEKFTQAYLEGSWDAVGSIDDLFTMEQVKAAFHRDPVSKRVMTPIIRPYEHRVISIDPAYMGDDKTVIYGWENELTKQCISYGKQDPMYTVGQVLTLEAQMQANACFVVDDTGGYGSGIVSALKKQYNETYEEHKRVIPVVNSESKGIEPCYYNMRAKLYWEAAEQIKLRRVAIPELDVELHGELCAIKYARKGGKIYIEPKEDIKKRLGKSPDRADSFVLGIYALKLLSTGKVQIDAPWVEQKPHWVKMREQEAERRHFEESSTLAQAGGYGGYGE